jgi:hypothetical protein
MLELLFTHHICKKMMVVGTPQTKPLYKAKPVFQIRLNKYLHSAVSIFFDTFCHHPWNASQLDILVFDNELRTL